MISAWFEWQRRNYAEHKERYRRDAVLYRQRHPEVRKSYRRNNPKQSLLEDARARARKYGVPCTITRDDFEVPDVCPVLGIRLERGVGKLSNNSPSLDRVIPERGYVPGNVCVISYKANRLKNNATLDELKKIVEYIKGYL